MSSLKFNHPSKPHANVERLKNCEYEIHKSPSKEFTRQFNRGLQDLCAINMFSVWRQQS